MFPVSNKTLIQYLLLLRIPSLGASSFLTTGGATGVDFIKKKITFSDMAARANVKEIDRKKRVMNGSFMNEDMNRP